MDDYFRKALTWAQSRASAVETSQLGLVQNALTHLHGAVGKRNFACALARGFGANMAPQRVAQVGSVKTAGSRGPPQSSIHDAGPLSFKPAHCTCKALSMPVKPTGPELAAISLTSTS